MKNPLNRRNFLRLTTGLGLAVGLDYLIPAYGKPIKSLKSSKNEIKYSDIIDLTIQETSVKIGGQAATGITVNNTIPAPLIRLKEGQTAKINVTNNLNQDTSIHWHGIILPSKMDGVPGVSFAGIKPGQTFTYEFPVIQNGTYWYHSHSGLQEQRGHFGAMIIDPIEPEPFEYDKDYVVILSDWTYEDPHDVLSNLKKMSAYYNNQRRTIEHLSDDSMWREMRMDPTDIADVTGATYSYLMNGLVPETNWTGLFQPGEKVRLRFINAAAMTFFDVRIPGLRMTVVQADGQNIQPVTVDEFRIGVSETYDVIVQPRKEEAYTIFAETMDRSGYARGTLAISKGMSAPIPKLRERPVRSMKDMGMNHDMSEMNNSSNMNHDMSGMNNNSNMNHDMSEINNNSNMNHDMSGMNNNSTMNHDMSEHNDQATMDHDMFNDEAVMNSSNDFGVGNAGVPMMVQSRLNEPGIGLENTGTRVLTYSDLRNISPGYDQRKPDREIELHLTGNMERYMWSFNGKKYSEEKEITFYKGERLRLTFINQTMMEHPIHLHGMWMELDNGAGKYKPRKHTVIVKPAEKMSVEVNVDVSGKWPLHCHLLYHMKVGMFRTVAIIDRPVEAS
ncbi:copper resistance system multicopper oxidase [Crocosphaera sp. XPORK-15E]|uniref:copper resistance system multicopper oxidase n=1 Tax=Crocosphaera sp. XPORK-15E TaxID=3110247 RepID=UPI002B217D48|nr:copper resistance system multicopper oxidase [Crocosphaera sp. XPORK-15E]MEA5533000.1 copper resistance system multicopper oxidase [Crocosphaera sp. XPORK-15E]